MAEIKGVLAGAFFICSILTFSILHPFFIWFACAMLYDFMQIRQYYSPSLSLFGSVAVKPTPTADVTIAPDHASELKL